MTDALRDACYCTDEGPCESHVEVLCSREGASLHTADELCAIFIGDVEDLRHDVRPWDAAMADAVALAEDYWEAHPSGGWCEDPDMSQALSEAVGAAESVLASEVGAFVWWDDGYVVGRVTGGPLADEDDDDDDAPRVVKCGMCWRADVVYRPSGEVDDNGEPWQAPYDPATGEAHYCAGVSYR